MQQADVKRLTRYGAGLIMALLLGDMLSPAELRASCGDHVHFSGTMNDKGRLGADQPLPAPSSCTGPGCSRHEAPPLAPTETPPTTAETWGCLHVPLWIGDDGRWFPSPSCDRSHLVRTPSSIFHPPRP